MWIYKHTFRCYFYFFYHRSGLHTSLNKLFMTSQVPVTVSAHRTSGVSVLPRAGKPNVKGNRRTWFVSELNCLHVYLNSKRECVCLHKWIVFYVYLNPNVNCMIPLILVAHVWGVDLVLRCRNFVCCIPHETSVKRAPTSFCTKYIYIYCHCSKK